jgi:RNA polymerase sigma-70 factor (ECF subfamily)
MPAATSGLRGVRRGLDLTREMPTHRRRRNPPLTLVASTAEDIPRVASGRADWSRLMSRAQEGDRQSYRVLLEDVTPYLRSLAAKCFKQESDVEDAVQDVLLTVHAIRHTYDPSRPFGPWLLAIANRRIVDRLRSRTRASAREIALSAEHETFTDHPTNLDEAAEGARLKHAIEGLPPDQRQAITLLKLNEMSLKEAAAVSGRSVATLKVATHRAIANLRRILRLTSR